MTREQMEAHLTLHGWRAIFDTKESDWCIYTDSYILWANTTRANGTDLDDAVSLYYWVRESEQRQIEFSDIPNICWDLLMLELAKRGIEAEDAL